MAISKSAYINTAGAALAAEMNKIQYQQLKEYALRSAARKSSATYSASYTTTTGLAPWNSITTTGPMTSTIDWRVVGIDFYDPNEEKQNRQVDKIFNDLRDFSQGKVASSKLKKCLRNLKAATI